jgi:trk system potassium uptake protein TrkA
MAQRLAHGLVVPNVIDYIELSRDFSIVEIPAPVEFVGRTLKQLELRPRYGLTLIAVKRQGAAREVETNISPAADDTIREGDVLSLLGSNEKLAQLERLHPVEKK